MIKIAVCDDDAWMHSEMTKKIDTYMAGSPFQSKVASFLNAEDLLASKEPYDIIFLDIQMNGLNGMDAAKEIRKTGLESYIVFVSVLRECVYDAFEVEASDYLLKPLEEGRFQRTMDRILHYIESKEKKSLVIQKGTWYKSIRHADILYCEAINRKIYVHSKTGIVDYYFKIEELEKLMTTDFFRCHRSYLVNLRYVCGYQNGVAVLESGEEIPVSRLRQQAFVAAILRYMKEGKS